MEDEWNKFLASLEWPDGVVPVEVLKSLRKAFEAGYEIGWDNSYDNIRMHEF